MVNNEVVNDNKLKTIAIVFGSLFLIVGILGFVPQVLVNGNLLFGLFKVNTVHNLIHVATGIVGLLCGLNSECASRLFFKIFGIIYGLIALLGMYYQNHDMFNGLIAHNIHDLWLHILASLAALYLGFFTPYSKHECRKDKDNEEV